jgi:hypothetical protein
MTEESLAENLSKYWPVLVVIAGALGGTAHAAGRPLPCAPGSSVGSRGHHLGGAAGTRSLLAPPGRLPLGDWCP